ncbi:hypothetical protein FACS189487_05930 [Campylobacterota bacterium]|nr:hypothetical protein FACS189487_05930 [Campylobacterota bacterium]
MIGSRFSKIYIIWTIAFISAIIVMSSAVYHIYFAQSPKKKVSERDFKTVSVAMDTSRARTSEPIEPLKKPANLDAEKIALGRALFHDPRLSHDDSVSCASCHDLMRGGVDRLRVSVGVDSKLGDINAPTVYNSALSFRQFWDGRARDLEEQAIAPIVNPVEMASSMDEILPKLNSDANLVTAFRAIYRQPPNAKNVIDALVEFEKSLITPSRFDRWLLGDDEAITETELKGYRLFIQYGCVACHQGEGVGGNLFQRFGIMHDYYTDRCATEARSGEKQTNCGLVKSDFGRFNVTGREEDRFVFKVPTLRNVELTPPYFHDGSAQTLEEAVAKMGLFQLGIELPIEDMEDIATFLRALSGEELQ